ncbi:MAG: undecaprenyldiphospho-muramoylpentapeptide beta-N-acetylglucosaminyltransferase [Clostridia bacterium]|nr:undecaprenyldiphospho-muramoylpentapeptide beta-N-acetylglucosaminyltransferase [Clostridia bacterium]
MRILFAGGGTAGHINPAIAVANHIREKDQGSEILFVGTKQGMESTLVPKQGYELRFIKIHGFKRSMSLKNIKTVTEIFDGVRAAKKIIKEFRPDVVMGTGGYVTGPVLLAAAMMKIPTLVHEANAYPGVTIRILSRFADVVALSMEEASKFIPKAKRIEITGNPVRPSILAGDQKTAKEKLGISDKKVILIFGGSLGAAKINSVCCDWISSVIGKDEYHILMSTGKNNQYERVIERFKENGIDIEKYPMLRVSEYIYDMDLALNAADLVIARSGGSVSEMTALGKAAILIPSPYVAGNHQLHNARAVERSGGALVITEDELSKEKLSGAVSHILENDDVLQAMSRGSKSIGIPDSADRIFKLLKEIAKIK